MIVCPFQPTVFPSLYVFNRAHQADLFIMMLSAQFCAANKKEDGNKGKTGQRHLRVGGTKPVEWLSVPIVKELKPLRNTYLKDTTWRDNLMAELEIRYAPAPYFCEYRQEVSNILRISTTLGELNANCFSWGHDLFNLVCEIKDDLEVCEPTKGNDWVHSLVTESGCDTLITGKPSLNYLDTDRYKNSNLNICVQDWTCRPYPQISTDWISGLSMLDALFNIGAEATALLIKTK